MSWLTVEFALQLAIMLGAAGAVYGGIRSDLKHMQEDIARAERLGTSAHRRIDKLFEPD